MVSGNGKLKAQRTASRLGTDRGGRARHRASDRGYQVRMPGDAHAEYNINTRSRYRQPTVGVAPAGSGADYHTRIETDFLRGMELARAFDRNDMVVGQGIDRVVDNVLQAGMKLDVDTGDKRLDKELARRWKEWSENPDLCDVAKELTHHEISKLVLRHTLVDGDIVELPLVDGSLQLIEAHRIRNPKQKAPNPVANGVELGPTRERIAYYILEDETDPSRTFGNKIAPRMVRDAVGNRILFHIYDPKRTSQSRGVSVFARIVDAVGMHDDIQFAKLLQQKTVSCFSILHELDSDALTTSGSTQHGAQTSEAEGGGFTRVDEELTPATEWFGVPGERLTGFSPNIPNQEWFDQTKLILTFVAVNLKIPLAVLLLDASQTNFSGWRGTMDQARVGFRSVQKWMIDRHYRPNYDWKLRQWYATDERLRRMAGLAVIGGKLAQVGRFKVDGFGHKWSPPVWNYIKPSEDVKADADTIKEGLDSRRNVLARRGLDVDQVDSVAVADRTALIDAAISAADTINAKHPEAAVDWRELLGEKVKLAAESPGPTEVTGTVELEQE